MSAVQNLKSRWAAVATPLTPASTPTHVPQQAAVKPTTYESPFNSGITAMPTTPTFKSLTPQKNPSLVHHTTPKSSRALKTPPNFSTPRTPNSSLDNPKGILRNEGSASKPNRVVFSTPIEQRNAPSDSDTSVLDIEVVNKSFQLRSTPESKASNPSLFGSGRGRGNVLTTPKRLSASPHSLGGNKQVSLTRPDQLNNSNCSAISSQSSDRLPRSRMIKVNSKKRVRSVTGMLGRKDESDLLTNAMKKHRAVIDHGHSLSAPKPVRESDSDCFGFGSD
ncbi:hypothetical protein EB796_018141 [Bugula neritina]|uniref:Uncharacterized protein n=1 Tax=Bugula neritina TaxID=10212 RepID=A0A7J7JD16_BUGNE|nr:hypothetical protein EB796_018141 [Bugula neritina]